ncbi:type II toxin-antitoxin system RelE/ParE family toxin [archaeon]|jgi:mRNA interferase RelE/StbE|nr:type II toxin-antitoxin system RelE/ParE family toxin [archaeon]MBT4241955.1 type II toxin-antitoxin system RelE/ParE family toxin [archaeon]MBT4418502.1 type II toxin-antitoxin system RelE/ParE family toxin [archaeon]
MYKIEFSQNASKQFDKLPIEIQNRVSSYLDRIRIRPYNYVKRLIGSPYFRGRIGEYRIILNIKNKELQIFVIEVGHRKNIYN